jgi:DNA-nicking Smr family endonuclease
MSERRRPRDLRPDERVLWETIARTARPLRGGVSGEAGAEAPASTEDEDRQARHAPALPKSEGTPRALEPMDRRLRTRVARGTAQIDGRVDLHGLTQREAHARLKSFLAEAQRRGARVVLVITGKGRPEGGQPLAEDARGVLRRAVPQWLASPEFRQVVSGFDEAHRSHGGMGALYVHVRRFRAE